MWTEFWIAVIVGFVVVYFPGAFIARALRRSIVDCFVYAPIISIAIYSCMGIVYGWVGVTCNWFTTFFLLLVVGVICWLIGLIVQKRIQQYAPSERASCKDRIISFIKYNKDWKYLAGYVVCGLCVTGFMYLRSLNGADAFSSEVDNAFHYGTVRTFVETGNWSSLSGGFYPSAWHAVCALVYSMYPTEITLITNAVNTLFIAFVLTSGMFAWIKRLFPNDNTVVLFGMFCSLVFDPLPWNLLVYGPTISFMGAICLLPAVMASFMDATEYGTSLSCKVRGFILFAIAMTAAVLMQTSVIFTVMIFALPYCWAKVLHHPGSERARYSTRKKLLIAVGLTILWLLIWMAAYFAPFMQGVLNFQWGGGERLSDAITKALTFSFFQHDMHLGIAAFTWVGMVVCFMKKAYRWIPIPFLYMVVAYVVCTTTDGVFDRILTGFWYTDPIRIMTMAALFAVPLMCCALAVIKTALMAFMCRHIDALAGKKAPSVAANSLITLALLALLVPTVWIGPEGVVQLGHTLERSGMVWEYNSSDDHQYSRSKSAFMREAAEIINGERVLNNPTDGSLFSWGIDGIDVVYRNMADRGPAESSSAIASNISRIASDPQVQAAVKETGAKYLLQLGTLTSIQEIINYPNNDYLPYWEDFYSVDENTPGLELVLQDGDMKLYRISA